MELTQHQQYFTNFEQEKENLARVLYQKNSNPIDGCNYLQNILLKSLPSKNNAAKLQYVILSDMKELKANITTCENSLEEYNKRYHFLNVILPQYLEILMSRHSSSFGQNATRKNLQDEGLKHQNIIDRENSTCSLQATFLSINDFIQFMVNFVQEILFLRTNDIHFEDIELSSLLEMLSLLLDSSQEFYLNSEMNDIPEDKLPEVVEMRTDIDNRKDIRGRMMSCLSSGTGLCAKNLFYFNDINGFNYLFHCFILDFYHSKETASTAKKNPFIGICELSNLVDFSSRILPLCSNVELMNYVFEIIIFSIRQLKLPDSSLSPGEDSPTPSHFCLKDFKVLCEQIKELYLRFVPTDEMIEDEGGLSLWMDRLKNVTDAFIKLMQMEALFIMFMSSSLESRINGLTDLACLIETSTFHSIEKTDINEENDSGIKIIRQFEMQWTLTIEKVVEWLRYKKIFEEIFGWRIHIELIRRCLPLFQFFCHNEIPCFDEIEFCLKAYIEQDHHEAITIILLELVMEIASILPARHFKYLLERIRRISIVSHVPNEEEKKFSLRFGPQSRSLESQLCLLGVLVKISPPELQDDTCEAFFDAILDSSLVMDVEKSSSKANNLITEATSCLIGVLKKNSFSFRLNLIMRSVKIIESIKTEKGHKMSSALAKSHICMELITRIVSQSKEPPESFFKEIDKRCNYIELLLEEFTCYCQSDESMKTQSITKDPKFNGIINRLRTLYFVCMYSSRRLTKTNIDNLWEIFVFNQQVEHRQTLFQVLSKGCCPDQISEASFTGHFPIDCDVIEYILTEKIGEETNLQEIDMTIFESYYSLFRCINLNYGGLETVIHESSNEEEEEESFDIAKDINLISIDILWKITIECCDCSVAEEAMRLLAGLHMDFGSLTSGNSELFLETCMHHLSQSYNEYLKLSSTGDNDLKERKIHRCLELMRYFVLNFPSEKSHFDIDFLDLSGLQEECSPAKSCTSDLQNCTLTLSPPSKNYTKEEDSEKFHKEFISPEKEKNKVSLSSISIIGESINLPSSRSPVKSPFKGRPSASWPPQSSPTHGPDLSSGIVAKAFKDRANGSNGNSYSFQSAKLYSNHTDEGDKLLVNALDNLQLEHKTKTPGILLAHKEENFEIIFEMLNLSCGISERAWELLCLLPVNEKLLVQIIQLRNSPGEAVQWTSLLSPQNSNALLYRLRVIEELIDQKHSEGYEEVEGKEPRLQWQERFVRLGGVNHLQNTLHQWMVNEQLQQVLSGLKESSFTQSLRKTCLSCLLRILCHFLSKLKDYPQTVFNDLDIFSSAVSIGISMMHQDQSCFVEEDKELILSAGNLIQVALCNNREEVAKQLLQDVNKTQGWLQLFFFAENLEIRTFYLRVVLEEIITIAPKLDDPLTSMLISFSLGFLKGIIIFKSCCHEFFQYLENILVRIFSSKSHFEPKEQQVWIDTMMGILFILEPGNKAHFSILFGLIALFSCMVINTNEKQVISSIMTSGAEVNIDFKENYASEKKEWFLINMNQEGVIHASFSFFVQVFVIDYEMMFGRQKIPQLNSIRCQQIENSQLEDDIRETFDNKTICYLKRMTSEILYHFVQYDITGKNTEKLFSLLFNLQDKAIDAFRKIGEAWNYCPEYDLKLPSSFVGLKNPGCVCYMNSLIQQLFMIPSFRSLILECAESDNLHNKNSSDTQQEFYQLQKLLNNLNFSAQKSVDPTEFCLSHKDYDGQSTDLRLQMDANEFFALLMDRIEECLKSLGSSQKKRLDECIGGTLVNQIITDNGNISERKEQFFALSIDVKNKQSLKESLEAYVAGEYLTGENSYYCEIEQSKVSATKRVCIGHLPDVLVIHLKRFEFDFETMNKVKLNDYLEFPMHLDMFPYTRDGLSSSKIVKDKSPDVQQYQLVGVVVHSGTAEMGHYYSFIQVAEQNLADHKDGDSENTLKKRVWFEFNDDIVSEFDVDNLKDECFGGCEHLEAWNATTSSYEEDLYEKPKSAYMLFYQRSQTEKNVTSPIYLPDYHQNQSAMAQQVLRHNLALGCLKQTFDYKNYIKILSGMMTTFGEELLSKENVALSYQLLWKQYEDIQDFILSFLLDLFIFIDLESLCSWKRFRKRHTTSYPSQEFNNPPKFITDFLSTCNMFFHYPYTCMELCQPVQTDKKTPYNVVIRFFERMCGHNPHSSDGPYNKCENNYEISRLFMFFREDPCSIVVQKVKTQLIDLLVIQRLQDIMKTMLSKYDGDHLDGKMHAQDISMESLSDYLLSLRVALDVKRGLEEASGINLIINSDKIICFIATCLENC